MIKVYFGDDGYEICCRTCLFKFWICRSCYRCHRYCSLVCKIIGRARSLKISKKKFEQSIEAREDHRDRQRAYRERMKDKVSKSNGTVTEQSIGTVDCPVIVATEFELSVNLEYCIFCCKCRDTESGAGEENDVRFKTKSTVSSDRVDF